MCYGNLGVICLLRNELEEAEANCQKSLKIATQIEHQEIIGNQYVNLAAISRKRNELKKASTLLKKAREVFERIGMLQRVEEISTGIEELNEMKKGKER